jgi:hypothetical protein
MEKQNGTRMLSLVALCVALVGVSLGFAAFSNTLTISSSANVNPSTSTFNVDFSNSASDVVAGTVKGSATTGATAGDATIVNGSDSTASITGLSATFTNIGQSVTYTFYAHNKGEYDAFLNSITYGNADGSESQFRVCTPGSGADATMVSNACNTISVSVKVGNDDAVTSSSATISNHKLAIGDNETVVVTITYAGDSSVDNSARADGPFTVAFGDISLTYGSVD